jgi:hypothetical protein
MKGPAHAAAARSMNHSRLFVSSSFAARRGVPFDPA